MLIVAHSLGCLATVEWLARGRAVGVAGAVLVAPPDDAIDVFPERCPSFIGVARHAASVPLLLIASSDDPFCSTDAAAQLAERWKAELVVAGDLGHINSDSASGRGRTAGGSSTTSRARCSAPQPDRRQCAMTPSGASTGLRMKNAATMPNMEMIAPARNAACTPPAAAASAVSPAALSVAV